MKTTVQVKDEPVELQVNELLRLYGYNLADSSAIKTPRSKSTANQEPEASTCAWCQKLGVRLFTLQTDNGDTKTLCSEVCFNQYRRASFKKNRGPDSDNDHHPSPIVSTIKNKSPEKKNGTTKSDLPSTESNRRKLILPLRRLTPIISKTKSTRVIRKSTPSPVPKRHRSSSSPHTNGKLLRSDTAPSAAATLPVSLTWQPSLLLPSNIPWPAPIDINRFQYPVFAPPPPPVPLPPLPPPPPPPPSSVPSLPVTSSSLFATLTKGTLSNFTCILPSFIPLPIPIPIPLCFPVPVPCTKCSVEVNDQQSQTATEDQTEPQRTRRTSL